MAGSCTASPGVDVLHPLARLHSVHSHSWREKDVWPKHCVLLQDIVAVLENNNAGDRVYISSTNDLSSWTSTRLPHSYTSLSTYQDQLVAVGGRYPSTGALTNELLTSSNGRDWQSTLPAMPTKRFYTSSVSGGPPAILVVAGGRGSDGQDFDIVEVLLDNQWSTVAPLPEACKEMRSTLHAGSIYFIHRWWDTMCTCTCESLCTALDDKTSTSVWTEIKEPHYTMTIASCASRLVTIDRDHVIRGYNNGHWTETTVEGDWEYRRTSYDMAAVELPTGGLLVARKDGVYTLTLSVDTFDPDSKFISNVFSRLEIVMGVQIVSVLANLHKQLTTSLGVDMPYERRFLRKVPIPDPKSPHQYLEELMSHWSSGYSPRLPAWRELLLVLQDVGQQELAQQIEAFMKRSRGDEDSHDSSKADDVHPDSGFSLADYPSLPKFVDGEKKVLAGFSADNEVSVTYRGESGSLDWEECGLTLLFKSNDHSSEVSECPVHVSAGESGAFRYPPRVELASRAYHIDCPKQLPAPVTIRIKHNVSEEDIPYLHFITCSEDQPPYDYTILNEGNFTATTAEISVTRFSFYILGILRKCRVKRFLSIRERSYAASLHCSVQPTQSISAYSWKVYVSAVKNCACFKQSIKKYIKEEYEDDVKLEANQLVNFVDTVKSITAITSFEPPLRGDVHMNPYESPVINKADISRYVDATLPHIRYDLQVPLQLEGASLKIKITLEGLQEPKNYLCIHLTVPHLSSPLPVSLPHGSDRLSSELESSSHTGSSPLTVSNRSSSLSSPEQEPCARSGCYAFTMKNLRVLHIGPDKELRLIEEMSSQWKEAGDLLGLRISHTRVIQENNPRNIVDCCREVMAEWLDDEKGRYNYPPNWEGLCKLLKDLKLGKAAEHIQNMVLT